MFRLYLHLIYSMTKYIRASHFGFPTILASCIII
nr:MAG TPA: hypothetical protein [Caudoviricetes sp.]